MNKFTDNELLKLKNYLIDNAEQLANEGKISLIPKYTDEKLRDYTYTMVELPFGKIEMYFTLASNIVKINSVFLSDDEINRFEFTSVESTLLKAYRDKKRRDASNWINNLLAILV